MPFNIEQAKADLITAHMALRSLGIYLKQGGQKGEGRANIIGAMMADLRTIGEMEGLLDYPIKIKKQPLFGGESEQ